MVHLRLLLLVNKSKTLLISKNLYGRRWHMAYEMHRDSVSDIFAVEMCLTSTLTFRMLLAKVKHKYANQKRICHFLFAGSSNVWPVCYHLSDIRSTKIHYLDLEPRLNLNRLIKSLHLTSKLMAIVMFSPISHHFRDICSKKIIMCMTLTLTFRMGLYQI